MRLIGVMKSKISFTIFVDLEDTSMCSGSTNSSGSYSGAPYFVQTLKNLTVTEGDPVRFDANINANPHPKVSWYFKNFFFFVVEQYSLHNDSIRATCYSASNKEFCHVKRCCWYEIWRYKKV